MGSQTKSVSHASNESGTVAWTGLPTAVKHQDNQFAETVAPLPVGGKTVAMKTETEQFSVPTDQGPITAKFRVQRNVVATAHVAKDDGVYLLIGGVAQSTDLSKPDSWPVNPDYAEYTITDLAPSVVNSAGFGLSIAVKNDSLTYFCRPRIGHIEVQVFWG